MEACISQTKVTIAFAAWGPMGIITTLAGTGDAGFTGDGGPVAQARLRYPQGVAVGADGNLYIADTFNHRIRRVGSDGIITTLAGTGDTYGFAGDGGPATQALLSHPQGVAVGADGNLYIADAGNNRIRQLRSSLPGSSFSDIVMAAEDGSEVYVFTSAGRHLRTLDALTGTVRFQFTYDGAGRLATVADSDGNVTTIERDGSGNLSAIVAPFGQRTTLAVNGDGSFTVPRHESGRGIRAAHLQQRRCRRPPGDDDRSTRQRAPLHVRRPGSPHS